MNREFEKKANSYAPLIYRKEINSPVPVDFADDKSAFQGVRKVPAQEMKCYRDGDSACLDFGRHITGYVKFDVGQYGEYLGAPVRLKLKFAETPYEMYRDFETYKPGLCSSWLQEEIINVDMKGEVRLERRYAFRYMKITVVATPEPITLGGFVATACTSADFSKIRDGEVSGKFKDIDRISVNTLAECMQDFFEDGPKRDRRLWLGDLRLQALADYHTFKNYDLVKRCLYLFAAFDSEDKLLPSFVYTKPQLETSDVHIVSYALLFTVALCDYFEYTGDNAVVDDLFDTAKRQIDITRSMLDSNGILTEPQNYGWWTFIDWTGVKGVASTMGIYIYAVSAFADLCRKTGRESNRAVYGEFAEHLKSAAFKYLYDGSIFRSEYDENQLSVHSQVWLILAGVVSVRDAQRILKMCIGNKDYLQPVTPYMHHYVVQALINSDMKKEAENYILGYWGEMVKDGADTFWEVYDRNKPFLSPYGDAVINSACHAWSCTPAYFIRKYNMQ